MDATHWEKYTLWNWQTSPSKQHVGPSQLTPPHEAYRGEHSPPYTGGEYMGGVATWNMKRDCAPVARARNAVKAAIIVFCIVPESCCPIS